MNVLNMLRPRYTVYGVPTFLMIESSTYRAGSLNSGRVYESQLSVWMDGEGRDVRIRRCSMGMSV